MSLWRKNLAVLREKDNNLAVRITAAFPEASLNVINSRCGLPTLVFTAGKRRFYLHSAYDPEREALRWADEQEVSTGAHLLVYGFGLGYHIRALLDIVGPAGSVLVFHLGEGFFRSVVEEVDLTTLLSDPRLSLIVSDAQVALARRLSSLSADTKLLLHGPSLQVMPEGELKEALVEYAINKSTVRCFGHLLDFNFRCNWPVLGALPLANGYFGALKGRPAVLVAGGPSLDEALPFLKKIDGVTIMAVGTALTPLAKAGLKPHFVIVTDPQPVVVEQLAHMDATTPLIVLPTVSPEVLACHPGPKLLAFQAGFSPAEELAASMGVATVETGGSVSTTALDILIRMGAEPVVLVGLDLAFPGDRLHASGTFYGDFQAGLAGGELVSNNQGGLVATSKILNIYRRWVEKRISREKTTFINTSLQGARIAGTVVLSPEYLTGLVNCGGRN